MNCNTVSFSHKELLEESKTNASLKVLPPIKKISALPSDGTPVLIDGLWRREEVLLLGGHAKSWKSWAHMDLSYCIANGLPWLMWEKVNVGPILHIDLELFDFEIRKRFILIGDSYGVGSLEGIDVLSLRGRSFDFNDFSSLVDKIPIPKDKYAAISFDPTYRMIAGSGMSECDSGTIVELMNRALELARRTGSGISLLQHFSKGDQSQKRDLDAFSGSGVWGRAPDVCVAFREHNDERCYTVSSNLRHWLGREPFVVEFANPRFRIADHKDPDNLKRSKAGRPVVFSVEALCDLIDDDEYVSYTSLLRRANSQTSENTFKRRLKEAKLNDWLALNPVDSTYFLTSSYLKKHRNAK